MLDKVKEGFIQRLVKKRETRGRTFEVDGWMIIYLNILSLLKKECKSYLQLWDSASFRTPRDLRKGLIYLRKASLIHSEDFDGIYLYTIAEMGIKFLHFFKGWEPRVIKRNVKNSQGYEYRKEVEEMILRKQTITIRAGRRLERLKSWEIQYLKSKKRNK